MSQNIFKKILKAYLYIFIFPLFISCKSKLKANVENNIIFRSFPIESRLNFEPVFKFEKSEVRKLFLMDSSLVVWNVYGVTDYFFYEYSLNSKKFIRKFIKGGRGFGQGLGAFQGDLYNSRIIWLHDISLKKLLTVSFSSKINKSDTLVIHEYPIYNFYYSVQLIDTARILVSGSLESDTTHSRFKLQELELKTGKEIAKYGSFTDPPDGIALGAWKMAHQAFLFLKPTKDKAVLACRFTDQIEIFDLHTKKSKLIQGSEKFEPEFTPIKVHHQDIITRNDKTRFAFINGMVTRQYIYLLYSGKKENKNHANVANCIYVYDWEGKPVKKFDFDQNITCFTVSDHDDIMYAFDHLSGFIVKTKIKI